MWTWFDTAYVVNEYKRSHTGGMMSMGVGTLNSTQWGVD